MHAGISNGRHPSRAFGRLAACVTGLAHSASAEADPDCRHAWSVIWPYYLHVAQQQTCMIRCFHHCLCQRLRRITHRAFGLGEGSSEFTAWHAGPAASLVPLILAQNTSSQLLATACLTAFMGSQAFAYAGFHAYVQACSPPCSTHFTSLWHNQPALKTQMPSRP